MMRLRQYKAFAAAFLLLTALLSGYSVVVCETAAYARVAPTVIHAKAVVGRSAGYRAAPMVARLDSAVHAQGNWNTYITWNYRAGDKPAFARPDFDDSSDGHAWEPCNSRLLKEQMPETGWFGIGWFRLRLEVAPELVGKPLGVYLSHRGAVELYIDGERVFHNGVISVYSDSTEAYCQRIPITIVFARPGRHLLAVRYANHHSALFHWLSNIADGISGFTLFIYDSNKLVAARSDVLQRSMRSGTLVLGITLILAILHGSIFFLYPRLRMNAFYALTVLAFGVSVWAGYQGAITTRPAWFVWLRVINTTFQAATFCWLLFFTYSIATNRRITGSWRMWSLIILGGAVIALWISGLLPSDVYNIWIALVMADIAVVVARSRHLRERSTGIWIIAMGGFVPIGIFVVLILLPEWTGIFAAEAQMLYQWLGIEPVIAGFIVFMVSVSLYLAYTFTTTSKSLERRLMEVEELSAHALDQERLAAEREVDRKLLEADNLRKTQELEEARRRQLSMLPRTLPTLSWMELDAYMATANEVGGDYYDYVAAPDGALILAVGDATGHGAQAGYVVATTKSYVQSNAAVCDLPELARRVSVGLVNMNMRGMFMAMTFVRLEKLTEKLTEKLSEKLNEELGEERADEGRVRATIVAAGMPPVVVVRATTGAVERVVIKAMPLGAFLNTEYAAHEVMLFSGDMLVMMSDGLPERFNGDCDVFGYENAQMLCGTVRGVNASEALARLVRASEDWAQGTPLNDDMTLLVVRVL